MLQPLTTLSQLLESKRPTLTADELADLPDDIRTALLDAKILVPARPATHVVCDACHEDHIEEVVRFKSKGAVLFRIPCPESGWVEVASSRMRQWTVDADRFANLIATALGASGETSAIISGRLWRLGKVAWQTGKRESLFARGLHLDDAQQLVSEIQRRGRVLVIVAEIVPPNTIWPRRPPAILPLTQFATLSNEGLAIDTASLATMIAEADKASEAAEADAIDRRTLEQIVRRQVKAENKSALTDDAIVQAYRQHGSYRKAAAALSTDGHQVHHSTIGRVVKRATLAAVARGDSSDSVRRTVASQRRDGKKNIRPSAEAVDIERDNVE